MRVFHVFLLGAVLLQVPVPPAIAGPDVERAYFSAWHGSHSAVLAPDVLSEMWSEIDALPGENTALRSYRPWTPLGPYGLDAPSSTRYSGRLLDLDYNGSTLRFASASGGLWEFAFFIPVPLTETLSSQAIGTVATDPLNEDHLFIGTGEPTIRSGTGMYETWDRGARWDPVTLPISPQPSAFFRIRYAPGRPTHLYAATTSGLFRSVNAGSTWTYEMSGQVSDFVLWPGNPDYMWAGRWNDGVYRSLDAGDTWTKVYNAVLPTTNVGRTALTIWTGSPITMYVSMARYDNNLMLGVYRTANSGMSWTDVSPGEEIFGSAQGNYDNVITVNPDDPYNVILGGVPTFRTTDAGVTWTRNTDPDQHADVHAFLWKDGTLYSGHDGGFSSSVDGGATWGSSVDFLPTLQFYNIDVGLAEPAVMGGGLQDNGVAVSTDGGGNWTWAIDQDGGGFAVDAVNPVQRMWATKGITGYSWAFPRFRTTDRGGSWSLANNGIPPSGQWFTQVRHDHVAPVWLYTQSDNRIYRSVDGGSQWAPVDSTVFAWSTSELAVSRYQPVVGATIWAATASGTTNQLMVWDGIGWEDRTGTLPQGRRIRRISTPEYDAQSAYVLMSGISSGQQIFHTVDRGTTWVNVTGDLPAIPVGDLVEHPTDSQRLYLGTEMGCFRSTDGGTHWQRWNDGMPEAAIVTDFATIDSLYTAGRYTIVAGTFGRGFWQREISAEDATGVAELRRELTALHLSPPRPNPVRGSAEIEFSLREAEDVSLAIYDVMGREVTSLAHGRHAAGTHRVRVDTSRWSSGVYFVHLASATRDRTRRMTVIR